jgi:hypothetical protein
VEHAIISCDEFTASLPEAQWLVEDIFERDSLVSLFGNPGSMKSFIALSFAAAIATGTPWMGKATIQGPVVYCAGEGVRGMARRAAGWKLHHGIDAIPDLHFYPGAPEICDPLQLKHFIEKLAVYKPVLVVIDTLARSLAGDENSGADMGAFVKAAETIEKTLDGCTVLILHHCPHADRQGKMAVRERGHSSLPGAIDTSIGVVGGMGDAILTCRKQKDDVQFEPIHLSSVTMVLKNAAETSNKKDMTTLVLVPGLPPAAKLDEHSEHLLAAFKSLGGAASWEEWVEEHNRAFEELDDKTLYKYRKKLVDAGLVVQVKRGGVFTLPLIA